MSEYVEIIINEKPLRLRFDFNALADLEDLMGFGISELFSEKRIGVSVVRALIWAALKWDDKTITPQKVGIMIQDYLKGGGDLADLMDKVTSALTKSGLISEGNVKAGSE